MFTAQLNPTQMFYFNPPDFLQFYSTAVVLYREVNGQSEVQSHTFETGADELSG